MQLLLHDAWKVLPLRTGNQHPQGSVSVNIHISGEQATFPISGRSLLCSALDSIPTNVSHAGRRHCHARSQFRFKQTFSHSDRRHCHARSQFRFKQTFHTRTDGIITLGSGFDSNKRCTRGQPALSCSVPISIQTNVSHSDRQHYHARLWFRLKQALHTRAAGIVMLGPGLDSNNHCTLGPTALSCSALVSIQTSVAHSGRRHCHARSQFRFKQTFSHSDRRHYHARLGFRFKQALHTRAAGIVMLGPGLDSNKRSIPYNV